MKPLLTLLILLSSCTQVYESGIITEKIATEYGYQEFEIDYVKTIRITHEDYARYSTGNEYLYATGVTIQLVF